MFVKVLGGAGFVGNHVVKRLAKAGHTVTVLDMKKPKVRKADVYVPGSGESSWENKIKFERIDIRNFEDVDWAIDRGDFVIHLAAVAQFAQAEGAPQVAASINVAGTANVQQACVNNNASHLIYASTGSVLSTTNKPPFTEEMPADPESMYGMSKLWGEKIVLHYADKIPTCVLRFPHIIGSGKFWGANRMLMDMMEGKRPSIFGDGETKNDFTHVEDIAQAVELAMLKSATGIYNIGSGKSRSTLDFVKWGAIALDKPDLKPILTAPRGVDFDNFEYDISKARKELGYNPKFNLEDGLKKTINEWAQWL